MELNKIMTLDYAKAYYGKTILVTGHTGFKGAWLATWLHALGAKVIGYSLEDSSNGEMFKSAKLSQHIVDIRGDILDEAQLSFVFEKYRPEFVFHLAAQPLVRKSYDCPKQTFTTNVIGTINILECIKKHDFVKGALIITTDKVYAGEERWSGYRESDPLKGASDPYSSSKACAEIAVESYRGSFFGKQNKFVATVRAGNVLGGGDFGEDRIIPDSIRALAANSPIKVRNPKSIRPWQFILDVLNGYLTIGQKLLEADIKATDAWNIGPHLTSVITVEELADMIVAEWGSGLWIDVSDSQAVKKESKLLNLDISKSYFEMGIRPIYNIKEAIQETVRWYKSNKGDNGYELCLEQIKRYQDKISEQFKQNDTLKECRYCKSRSVKKFFDYGEMPLVNNLPESEKDFAIEEKYSLTLYHCLNCGLVQIGSIAPPEKMFSKYLYFSSTSSTFVKHGQEFAKSMQKKLGLNHSSFVVEIASNDGTVLNSFKTEGIPYLGIDPAENVVKAANENGIATKCAYFNSETASEILKEKSPADLIYGINVFAHVPEIHDFIKGMRLLLKDSGVIVIEAPYIIDFLKNQEFDTVYHEHVNYLGLHPMKKVFEAQGLELFDAEWQDIHGGSMRYFFARKGQYPVSRNVYKFLYLELAEGLFEPETFIKFSEQVGLLKNNLINLLSSIKKEHKNIVGYSASAKGIVLMNSFNIGSNYLGYITDKSRHKQGHFIPGQHLPIFAPEKLLQDQPDYVLLLSWNFRKEIMKEQEEYLKRGGKFIVPIPKPKIYAYDDFKKEQESEKND